MAGIMSIDIEQWYGAGTTTQTGGQNNNNVTNDVNTAIQSFNAVLNAVGFLDNAKNFVTAMEEFGEGIQAALVCISLDLSVVSNGVTAAAAAFSALDAQLGSTIALLDQQLPYFTNTTSSVTLPQPTQAEIDALNSLLGLGNPGSDNPGIHLSMPNMSPGDAGAGLLGLGALGGIIILGLAF